jgi:hypothetical protein
MPTYRPVYLAKIDIADGFYRIAIHARDVPRLGVILPTADSSAPLVALPLALPMRWVKSLPYFTSITKTACNLLNTSLQRWHPPPPHHLESLAATPQADIASTPTFIKVVPSLARVGLAELRAPPFTYGDVSTDNFI